MPGFSAEGSLRRTIAHYKGAADWADSILWTVVIPQAPNPSILFGSIGAQDLNQSASTQQATISAITGQQ